MSSASNLPIKPTPARGLRVLCVVLALVIGVRFAIREALAAALTQAPNTGQNKAHPGSLIMPRGLVQRGAVELESVTSAPSATLESWLVEPRADSAKGTIVLLHGVRMDKRSLAVVGEALADNGYRALLVDLRGHGESSGRFLTYGELEARDISQLLDNLTQRGITLGCVGAYGFSYGGAVALELSARDPRVSVVVAVSPFSTLRTVVDDYRRKYLPASFSLLPRVWFEDAIDEAGSVASFDPDRSSPLNAVRRSAADLLLIHGTSDTQVPLRHSLALLSAAASNARLVTVPGAEHSSMPSDTTGIVRHETLRWFNDRFELAHCRAVPR